jgi:hypothetical protein
VVRRALGPEPLVVIRRGRLLYRLRPRLVDDGTRAGRADRAPTSAWF